MSEIYNTVTNRTSILDLESVGAADTPSVENNNDNYHKHRLSLLVRARIVSIVSDLTQTSCHCRSELAREELKCTAFIQDARVIVDALREQARSCAD
jgi:chaperonin GroEL (HSP60 family)